MDLILERMKCGDEGCFSYLKDQLGNQIAVSCTHSYQEGAAWLPKTQPGVYQCVRGRHSLDGVNYFETFEITGVAGHTGILFHPGNTELDSEGCECLGMTFGELVVKGKPMDAVLDSRTAFNLFMNLQEGCDQFELTVKGP